MCLLVKPNSLIIDGLFHFICPWCNHHPLPPLQLVHCCAQFSDAQLQLEQLVNWGLRQVKGPSMIQQVFFRLSGILSSISSSLHYHDCSSWTSWIYREILSELLSQSVVSVFSWNTLLLFHLAVSVHLGQVTFCKQLLLLLIYFSMLGPFLLFQLCDITPVMYCIFKCKPWCLPVKTGRNVRCHLGCHHQWAASMRLPLSHSIWLIVIIAFFIII